jgi:hypothetical protein
VPNFSAAELVVGATVVLPFPAPAAPLL